jgi:hypothetical protein
VTPVGTIARGREHVRGSRTQTQTFGVTKQGM